MAIRETGIYTEPTSYTGRAGDDSGPEFRTQGEANGLISMIQKLTADLGTMISLKIDLLKTEVREAVTGYAKDGIMLGAAAVMGVFAFLFLNFVLMFLFAKLFPVDAPLNYALGAGVVTLLYGIGAGVLFMMARKRMAKRSIVPERSVADIKRDKQWITDTIM